MDLQGYAVSNLHSPRPISLFLLFPRVFPPLPLSLKLLIDAAGKVSRVEPVSCTVLSSIRGDKGGLSVAEEGEGGCLGSSIDGQRLSGTELKQYKNLVGVRRVYPLLPSVGQSAIYLSVIRLARKPQEISDRLRSVVRVSVSRACIFLTCVRTLCRTDGEKRALIPHQCRSISGCPSCRICPRSRYDA